MAIWLQWKVMTGRGKSQGCSLRRAPWGMQRYVGRYKSRHKRQGADGKGASDWISLDQSFGVRSGLHVDFSFAWIAYARTRSNSACSRPSPQIHNRHSQGVCGNETDLRLFWYVHDDLQGHFRAGLRPWVHSFARSWTSLSKSHRSTFLVSFLTNKEMNNLSSQGW